MNMQHFYIGFFSKYTNVLLKIFGTILLFYYIKCPPNFDPCISWFLHGTQNHKIKKLIVLAKSENYYKKLNEIWIGDYLTVR